MFKELNKNFKSTIKEGTDLQSLEFKKLKDFIGESVIVDGFFFTDGDFGKQVVVVGNGYKINLPARYVEQFEEIQKDDDLVQAMFEGHMMMADIRSIKTKQGYTTGFDFEDC